MSPLTVTALVSMVPGPVILTLQVVASWSVALKKDCLYLSTLDDSRELN